MEYTLVFDGTTSSSSSLPSVNSWCILGSYNKEQTRRLLVQILVRIVHRLKFITPSIAFRFNPLTSRIWLSVLLSVTHFHVNQLREFGVRSSNHFYLIILSILIYCLLDNAGTIKGEVTCSSLLRVNLFSPKPSLPLIALFLPPLWQLVHHHQARGNLVRSHQTASPSFQVLKAKQFCILLQVQGSFEHLRVTWNIKTSTCQNSVIALTLDTKPSTEGCTIRKAFWKLSSNVRPIAITW